MRKLNHHKSQWRSIKCRNYKHYDVNTINKELLNKEWFPVYNTSCPLKAWSIMNSFLTETQNNHAPFIEKKVKGRSCPWLNDTIKSEMNERDKLLRIARKSNNETDWNVYKRKRNFVKNEIQRTKRSFFKNELKDNADNPSKFWGTIKNIFPVKSKSSDLPKSFKIDNELTNDKVKIANRFCKFFSSVASSLKRKSFHFMELVWRPSFKAVNYCRHQFEFKMVTDKEVLKHLQGLKRKCAVGLDNIPASFLKDTKYAISKPLAHIINCSLKSGIVPSDFKQARVAPIYKSGDRVDFDNYRPISILPAVSKILEKCVHRQLMDHIETHQLLSQFQFGFRKHHSTELATVYFTDEIRKAMDKGMLTGAIYIDLTKAFDTISHSSIIEKLPDFGITGMPQQWIGSYLFGRCQQVSFDGRQSSREPLFCGVPQGSILGPLFFLLHFNDSANVLSKCNITKYADDTVLYYSHKDINEVEKVMSLEFNLFSNWLKENELILNCKKGKTEVMVFGTNPRLKNLNDPPLRIQHQFTEIACTDSYKYLGLLLKSNLNLTEHIQQSISKASSRVYLLRKIRPMIDSKTSCKIFNAMILPFLTYCTFTIIGSIPEYLKSRILQLEARAQKVVGTGFKVEKSAKVLRTKTAKHVHRCLSNNVCTNFKNYFDLCSGRNTRNQGILIRLPKTKLEAARKSFYFQGAMVFNNLPIEIRKEKEFACFCRFLKKL